MEIERLVKPTSQWSKGPLDQPSLLRQLIRNQVQEVTLCQVKEALGQPAMEEKISEFIIASVTGDEVAPVVKAIVAGMVEPLLRSLRGY